MAKLAETIGLSFNDMVDITAWALYLVIFGVAMGKGLYDLCVWFGEIMGSLFGHLFFRTLGKAGEQNDRDSLPPVWWRHERRHEHRGSNL